ncbi:Neuropeptide Y receptor type 2 [Orchesella cincta]|uniref:Neuropeptide Y receptor type 2 n=1 Tax=Orchesella cincta TaxID=48709 RepID=A0A1D2N5F0_ORCCI|nr:Neuropeptide Y receptor type 2 [Orchesella cincta]
MELSWSNEERSTLNVDTFTTEYTEAELHNMNQSHYDHYSNYTLGDDIISHPAVQAIFYIVYATIFVLGIFGNVLVCFVVGRNKAMQTVTNFFITNLALADILLCALAVPFTPLYTFLGEWIFGRVLCHLVAYAQGTSVYISTLTLTSIAIDRFFVIIYPFKPRMRLTTCLLIITGIWVFALLATLPYGIFLHYKLDEDTCKYTCSEAWPSEGTRQVFSGFTVTLQFILPFIIMLFCYIKVSIKLSDRAKAKPGSKNSKKEALERERKRRTNRMLIAMVFIFGMSWLPLNVVNFLNDVYIDVADWKYSNLCFFFAHAVAMSSTCYNPFLYAWLNENFRKEFKQVLPCFHASSQGNSNRSKRFVSQRNCNGAETVQESLMPTTSQAITTTVNTQPANTTVIQVLETIDELNSSSQSAPVVAVDLNKACASFTTDTNEIIVHFPSSTPEKSSRPGGNHEGFDNNSAAVSSNNNKNVGKSGEVGKENNSTPAKSLTTITIEGNKANAAGLSSPVPNAKGKTKDSIESLAKVDAVVHSFEEDPCGNPSPDMINLKTFAVNTVLI